MCTCRERDPPRLRRFRASASIFFLARLSRDSEISRREEHERKLVLGIADQPSVGQGRSEFRPNYSSALEALHPRFRVFRSRRAAGATLDQYDLKARAFAYFQSQFTESTDGKTPARGAAISKSHVARYRNAHCRHVRRARCRVELPRAKPLVTPLGLPAILVAFDARRPEMLISTRYPVQNYGI